MKSIKKHSSKTQKNNPNTFWLKHQNDIKIATLSAIALYILIRILPLWISIARWITQPLGPILATSITETLFVFTSTLLEVECIAMLIIIFGHKKPEKSFTTVFYITCCITIIFLVLFLSTAHQN